MHLLRFSLFFFFFGTTKSFYTSLDSARQCQWVRRRVPLTSVSADSFHSAVVYAAAGFDNIAQDIFSSGLKVHSGARGRNGLERKQSTTTFSSRGKLHSFDCFCFVFAMQLVTLKHDIVLAPLF